MESSTTTTTEATTTNVEVTTTEEEEEETTEKDNSEEKEEDHGWFLAIFPRNFVQGTSHKDQVVLIQINLIILHETIYNFS